MGGSWAGVERRRAAYPVFAVGDVAEIRSRYGWKPARVELVVPAGRNPLTEIRRAGVSGAVVRIRRDRLCVRVVDSYVVSHDDGRGGKDLSWPEVYRLRKPEEKIKSV